MSVGANNTDGQRIASIFNESGYLPHDSFTEGLVAVKYLSGSSDDMDICLPGNANAALGGTTFLGIWMNAGTVSNDGERGPIQKLGIAKCVLFPNTICIKGQDAAYDPADGGMVVPYTSKTQIRIGRFAQSRPSQTYPQFVGVELTGAGGIGSGLSSVAWGVNEAASSPVTNTTTETAFTLTPVAAITIPANALVAGSTLSIRAKADVTGINAGDKVILRARFGGITGPVLGSSPTAGGGTAVAVGDIATLDLLATVDTTTTMTATGWGACGTPLTSTPFQTGTVGTVTINTLVANTIVITAQWNNANAADTIVLEDCVVS